jgi:tetratricopeptide (TPR) repeat protein
MYVEARDNYARILGEDDENTIKAIGSLGLLYWRWGRLDEALSLNETALERFRRTLGDDARSTIRAIDVLASTHQALGNLEQAEALYREGLDAAERVFGDDDPDTIRALGNLATVVLSAERLDEAEVLLEGAHARAARVFGETHYDTLAFYTNIAAVRSRRGDERAAEAIFREVVDKYHERVGRENEWSIRFRDNLAKCLLRQGRFDEGLVEWERVAEATSEHFGVGSTQAVQAWVRIALTSAEIKDETNRRQVIKKLKQALRAAQGEVDLPEGWLNSIAWRLLVDYPQDLRDPELGLICAQRANELSNHDNHAYLDTLALAHFQTGNVEAAIENVKKALQLAPEDDPSARDDYAGNLAEYEAARDQITDSK